MKFAVVFFGLLTVFGCAHNPSVDKAPRAVANTEPKLSDYSPYNYEVLFTEPVCKDYRYTAEVKSRAGRVLQGKPKNVFCSSSDIEASGSRDSSPQKRLVDWINDSSTTEIFLTYLTFSNRAVKEALCQNARTRNLKVTIALDNVEEAKAADHFKSANEVVRCSPSNVKLLKRGNIKGLGLAHNKITIFNPNSNNSIRIVFSSGNMTSGPVLHHENWHFVTTNVRSHFARAHLCVMNAELSDQASSSRAEYMKYIKNCRAGIDVPEESDIRTFFVPGEGEQGHDNRSGRRTAFDYLLDGDGTNPGIRNARQVWLACHRFLHNTLISELGNQVREGNFELKITADDDTYYDSNDRSYNRAGGTTFQEWKNIETLMGLGAQAKFMETNPGVRQLHHSKFVILDDKAVFTGAANFTQAAFRKNMENIYYITIPEVVQKFRTYYDKQWTTMATALEDLPTKGNLNSVIDSN